MRTVLVAWFAVVISVLTLLPGSGEEPDQVAGDRRDDPGTGAPPAPTEPTGSVTEPVPTTPTTPTGPPTDTAPPPVPGVEPCTPDVALVDAAATPEATCLARTLDDWRAAGRYGLGQQVNVSTRTWLSPVKALRPDRPALVGFDLDELAEGERYGFDDAPVDTLLGLAGEGSLLTASWHMRNPATGGDSYDRSWQDLGALLSPDAAPGTVEARAYQRFWREVDAKIELLRRFQTGDGGRHAPAAVLFRPFHEANGDWFWWAQGADTTAYRQLYAAVQQRVADAGVHNVVWGWSANARNGDHISDPLSVLPDRVDVAGVDAYESMADRDVQDTQLNMAGLPELAGRVTRTAVAEAGPHGSRDGNWDPAVVATSARALGVSPVYVMAWFDDADGKKQLGSLRGGPELIAGCDAGVCPLP